MERHDAILKRIENLKSLAKERDSLIVKLERSLAIQRMWPEAFAAGPVKTFIEGPLDALRFVVVAGDGAGERRYWPLAEVPEPLWSAARTSLGRDTLVGRSADRARARRGSQEPR